MATINLFPDTILRGSPNLSSKLKDKLSQGNFNCLNLEAPFVKRDMIGQARGINLFSDPQNINFLTDNKFKYINLANNHTFDFGTRGFRYTKQILKNNNINYFGAGENLAEASKPAIYSDNDTKIGFFGFAWDFTGAIYAKSQAPGVAPLQFDYIKKVLSQYKDLDQKICYMHWGTEREDYPEPTQLAFINSLIKDGDLDVAIGSHPHRIQGIRKKNKGCTFFSLGNFIMPEKKYPKGNLSYPETSHMAYFVNLNVNEELTYNIYPYEISKDGEKVQFPAKNKEKIFQKIDNLSHPLFKSYSKYRKFYIKKRNRKLRPCMTKSHKVNKIKKIVYRIYVLFKNILGRIIRKLGVCKYLQRSNNL